MKKKLYNIGMTLLYVAVIGMIMAMLGWAFSLNAVRIVFGAIGLVSFIGAAGITLYIEEVL